MSILGQQTINKQRANVTALFGSCLSKSSARYEIRNLLCIKRRCIQKKCVRVFRVTLYILHIIFTNLNRSPGAQYTLNCNNAEGAIKTRKRRRVLTATSALEATLFNIHLSATSAYILVNRRVSSSSLGLFFVLTHVLTGLESLF